MTNGPTITRTGNGLQIVGDLELTRCVVSLSGEWLAGILPRAIRERFADQESERTGVGLVRITIEKVED